MSQRMPMRHPCISPLFSSLRISCPIVPVKAATLSGGHHVGVLINHEQVESVRVGCREACLVYLRLAIGFLHSRLSKVRRPATLAAMMGHLDKRHNDAKAPKRMLAQSAQLWRSSK